MARDQLAMPNTSPFAPILDRIREEASKILKIPFERFFTDHSIEGHSSRILHHLYGLTHSLKTPLCEAELFILIGSAYLHDISLAWQNNMDFIQLRKQHPKLSGQLIRDVARGIQINGIQCEFGLPQRSSQFGIYTEYIARVVEGHGGTTDGDYFSNTLLDNSEIRVRFLADLLAFADELDLHRARVDLTRLAQSNMPEADIFHWWKHWFIVGVRVDQLGNVQISYAFPEDMRTNNEFPDLVQKYVRLRLQSEYAKAESTLSREGVSLHQPHPQRIFSDIAAPGEVRPSARIVELFRNAVSSFLQSTQLMLEPNEVSGNIELATQYFMDGMLPSVVGEKLYVRRRDSEEAFEEFVEHVAEQLFLLAGRPGTGKSMFIRRMVWKYPSFSLVYSYPGDTRAIEDLPKHIVEQYASIISNKLQAKKYRDLDIRKLEEIAKSKGKWVIIHIDSNLTLNDLAKDEGLLFRLFSTINGRNIKICLSCVADVGETLPLSDNKIIKTIYQPPSRMGVVAPSSVLEDYSEEEFANACLRYFGERKLSLTEADFVDEARDRLKNPLWLDIYSMAQADYPRTRIETSIRYVEVCESFLTNRSTKVAKVLNHSEGKLLVLRCLDEMAANIISMPGHIFERHSVVGIISTVFNKNKSDSDTIMEAMKMAGLLKESYHVNHPEGYIRFAFEEIREYLVARYSAKEIFLWNTLSTSEDIRATFSKVMKDEVKKAVSPYGIGVLEFLILLLEHSVRCKKPEVLILPKIDIDIVSQLLGDLVNLGIELGEQVCARVLGKLEIYPEGLPHLLNKLSNSQHDTVRRDLTYSLSALSRENIESTSDAREILSKLVNDRNESVACCAVAALIKSFEKELLPTDWIDKFKVISQSPRRGLVTTMMREFSRRSFPNLKEFYPNILKNLCLKKDSDYQISAAACDCLSKTWGQFSEEALSLVCGIIDNFRNTQHDDIVMRQAVPTLIFMSLYFQKEVIRFLEDNSKLKRNENLKCEIVRNYRKLSSNDREILLRILEKDDSPLVKALVHTARNI